jgi:hypothetical protein
MGNRRRLGTTRSGTAVRLLACVALAGSIVAAGTVSSAWSQSSSKSGLERLPLSGGVLMGRALQSGAVTLPG